MKRSAVKKRQPQNNRKNTIIFVLLLLSVLATVAILFYFQATKGEREGSHAQAAGSGWLSGASGDNIVDGSFASWRGSPVTIAGTWNDNSDATQKEQWSMGSGGTYGNWDQSIDDSIGGFWSGTWADVANGSQDANLHAALSAIDAGWGNKKTVFIRFAHEFNGSWYYWKVTPDQNENFKKAFARFYNMVQTDLVAKGRDAKVVWSPNSDEHNGQNTADSWPGDQYVDVVGVDYYDWDQATDQAKWDAAIKKPGSSGGPQGLLTWQAFAKSHGKPMSFPEWGTTGDGPVDDPFFIQKMNEFFRANAGTGPGQVWYEVYFDVGGKDYLKPGGQTFQIYPVADLPQTSAMYKSLKWGDGGISGGTTPGTSLSQAVTPTQEQLITPSFACVGGVNCVPSTSPNPSGGDNGNGGANPSVNPSENPQISISLSQFPGQGNGNGGNGGGRGGRGGFFEMIFQFFMQLIAFLLSLLGVKS